MLETFMNAEGRIVACVASNIYVFNKSINAAYESGRRLLTGSERRNRQYRIKLE